jgi:hypothetical protein
MALTDKLFEYNLRAGDSLPVPVLLAPHTHGTAGATSRSYVATFVTLVGETTPTAVATIATTNATLTSGNYVTLEVSSIPAAAIATRFYRLNIGTYKLLAEVAAPTKTYNDIGATLQGDIVAPSANTSGRPEWKALLFNHGKYLQRQELMDLQWICLRGIRDLGDITYKNGDIISGSRPAFVSGTTWRFADMKIYLDGQIVTVSGEDVEIVGTGEEAVGIVITPTVISDITAPAALNEVMRNQDEEIDLAYAQPGAHRLIYAYTWGVDQEGQLAIQAFVDNVPKIVTVIPESTLAQIAIARRTHDVSGSFSVLPFAVEVQENHTPANQETMYELKVGAGKAYPMGYEVETVGPRIIDIEKARDTAFVNNGTTGAYDTPGGYVVAGLEENYTLTGLKIKFSVGGGSQHTITFPSPFAAKTAAQVATEIERLIVLIYDPGSAGGIYPSDISPQILFADDASGYLKLQAKDGANLTIHTIANNAYTILDIDAGVYSVDDSEGGTRIYEINDSYVKDVADVLFTTEVVTMAHNVNLKALLHTGLNSILGAATTEIRCIDGQFDWVPVGEGRIKDFERDGNYISFDIDPVGNTPPAGDYYVKYRYSREATAGARTLTTVTDEEVVRTANATDLLSKADVVEILQVANTSGQSVSAYTTYSLAKNSDDIGHSLSGVTWGTPSSQPYLAAHYFVTYTYWKHDTEGDYVTADCYSSYDDLELSPDESLNLRDCIDFRTTSTTKPVNGTSPSFEYNYYLARRDKLLLDQYGGMELVQGNPAISPPVPNDQPTKLTLAMFYIKPYTYTPSEVIYQSVEPLRTTQIGITDMKHRIERLEYWQAVNDLENQTKYSEAATGAQGLFTDPITGQNRISTQFDKNGITHTAAIDGAKNEVKLPVTQTFKKLDVDVDQCVNVKTFTGKEWEVVTTGVTVGSSLAMDFAPVLYQESKSASRRMNVNIDNIWSFDNGKLTLTPESDLFFDQTQMPRLTIDYDNNMASLLNEAYPIAASEITWGSWNYGEIPGAQWADGIPWNWTGAFGASTHWAPAGRTGTSTSTSMVPDRQLLDLGNRVVDLTAIPFMRTKNSNGSDFEITIEANSLMPNADHRCYIHNIAVDLTKTGTYAQGTAADGYTTVTTDTNGRLTAKFKMPSGVTIGSSLVEIVHATLSDTSTAKANFFGGGIRSVSQGTTLGMTSARCSTAVTTVSEYTTVWDPIAQSFMITTDYIPLCCVDVYFAAKSLTKPITLEVRRMSNGQPTKDVITSQTLQADDITVSASAATPTRFWFPEIVSYKVDSFSLVLVTDCTEYEVWVSEIGDTDILTGAVIQSQSAPGVLFHSPNGMSWEQLSKQDMKYRIYRADFETSATVMFENTTIVSSSIVCPKLEDYAGPGTNVKYYYSLDNGVNWVGFRPWQDQPLGGAYTACRVKIEVVAAGTDAGRVYLINPQSCGLVTLIHQANSNYIGNAIDFSDALNYPDEVRFILDADADGFSGAGVRSLTPYYSVDDGETWAEVKVPTTYTEIAKDSSFYEWEFRTQSEAKSITGITAATPMVVTSGTHGFQNNDIVTISDVTGTIATVVNGTWRVDAADTNTYALVDPLTGADSVGSGSWSSGGTTTIAPFAAARARVYLETTDVSQTPVFTNVRLICNKRSA